MEGGGPPIPLGTNHHEEVDCLLKFEDLLFLKTWNELGESAHEKQNDKDMCRFWSPGRDDNSLTARLNTIMMSLKCSSSFSSVIFVQK